MLALLKIFFIFFLLAIFKSLVYILSLSPVRENKTLFVTNLRHVLTFLPVRHATELYSPVKKGKEMATPASFI